MGCWIGLDAVLAVVKDAVDETGASKTRPGYSGGEIVGGRILPQRNGRQQGRSRWLREAKGGRAPWS